MIKAIKRLGEDARVVQMLLREMLVYCMSYINIYSDDDTTGAFNPSQSGSDGETSSSTPQIFSSATGVFTSADIGKYLVLYGTASASIVGVHKVTGVPSATTLAIRSGIYGSSFTTATGISWRLVDPTLATAGHNPIFVVEAPSGTSPVWQASFEIQTLDADLIRVVVGPFGGYSNPTWTLGSTAEVQINSDTTPLWYILASEYNIRIWTENNAGSGMYNLGYVGAGSSRRSAYDANFAVCFGGVALTALAAIASLGSDDTTQVAYSALTFGDNVAQNMFTGMSSSEFDFRNDSSDIPIGTDDASFPEADRGILLGLQWVSNLISYRQFVDNGRQLLSLGDGIGIEWDGSLAR